MFLPGCICCGSCSLPPYMALEWIDTPPPSSAPFNNVSVNVGGLGFCADYTKPGIVFAKSSNSAECVAVGQVPVAALTHWKWGPDKTASENAGSNSVSFVQLSVNKETLYLSAPPGTLVLGMGLVLGTHTKNSDGTFSGSTSAYRSTGYLASFDGWFFPEGTTYRYKLRPVGASEATSIKNTVDGLAGRDKNGYAVDNDTVPPTLSVYGATFTSQSVSYNYGALGRGNYKVWDFSNQTATNQDGKQVRIGSLVDQYPTYTSYFGGSTLTGYSVRVRGAFQMVASNVSSCSGCEFGYSMGGVVVLSDPGETWAHGHIHHASHFSLTACRGAAFDNTFSLTPTLKQSLQDSSDGYPPSSADESPTSADTITIKHGTTNAAP